MRILITGGAGFLGGRLAREILRRGQLAGQTVKELVITDLFAAPADLLADPRIKSHAGPLLEQAELLGSGFDGVFHLASAVSGECELDFDLGLRSNLDSTRLLLDSLRRSGKISRLVFASSIAVFGPYADQPMPALVSDTTLPSPQTSYGTHKLMLESEKVMNCLEPLAGTDSICPVDASVAHPVSSPATTIASLIALFEASQASLGNRLALNLPGLNVTVQQMLDALEKVAGKAVRQRVHFERDERIAGIVNNWARGASSERALALGLRPDTSFESIIEQYIADCRTQAGYPAQALQGL